MLRRLARAALTTVTVEVSVAEVAADVVGEDSEVEGDIVELVNQVKQGEEVTEVTQTLILSDYVPMAGHDLSTKVHLNAEITPKFCLRSLLSATAKALFNHHSGLHRMNQFNPSSTRACVLYFLYFFCTCTTNFQNEQRTSEL